MKPVEPDHPQWTKDVNWRLVQFAKNQPQYEPLPAYIEDSPMGTVITEWELSEEERKAIAEGACIIRLSILTFQEPLQPVKLEVIEE
jgi:hypothetical protein